MQPDTPYGDLPDAPPEGGDGMDEVLTALDELITEIEAAPAGSEALDARIHFGFRVLMENNQDHASLLLGDGVSWPTVKAVLDDVIPPFTTSLDAALDDERITFVLRSAKRRRWGAMQKASCGEEVLAWARTEPLARRLAALKSWRADLAAAIKAKDVSGNQEIDKSAGAVSEQPAPTAARSISGSDGSQKRAAPLPHGSRNAGKADDKDWEVLF